MALRDSFERSGYWLFRWRSYLPLILFVVVAAAMKDFGYPRGSERLDQMWEYFCLFVAFIGLAIRIHVVGTTPTGTSGRNTRAQIADVLNTTGWYSVVRHPLYVGNYFMWLGVALFPRNAWLVIVVSLAFWLYYERIMFAEEAFLRQQFGDTFETWAAQTPAFIPNFRRWVSPKLPFSWKMVLRREYSGLYGVIASLTLLEAVGNFIVEGRLELDTMWTVLFATTTIVYVVLLSLKRRTRLLAVSGR